MPTAACVVRGSRLTFAVILALSAGAGSAQAADGGCAAPAEPAASPPPSAAVDMPDYRAAEAGHDVAWDRFVHNLSDALDKSTDARDRAISAFVASGGASATEQDRLAQAAAAAPDDALVQWIAYDVSEHSDAQPLADTALERLQHLEPDNAVVWLGVLERAARDKNADGADRALSRIATSSRVDTHEAEIASVLAETFARFRAEDFAAEDPDLADSGMQASDVSAMLAIMITSVLVPSRWSHVTLCDLPPDAAPSRRDDCAAGGRLLAQRGKSQELREAGHTMLRVSHTATPADQRAAREDAWLFQQFNRIQSASEDHDEMTLQMRAFLSGSDEYEIARATLQRANVALTPPDDWVEAEPPPAFPRVERDR